MASGSHSLLDFFPKLTDSAPRRVVLKPNREIDDKFALKEKRPVGRPRKEPPTQLPSDDRSAPCPALSIDAGGTTEHAGTDLPHSSASVQEELPGEGQVRKLLVLITSITVFTYRSDVAC